MFYGSQWVFKTVLKKYLCILEALLKKKSHNDLLSNQKKLKKLPKFDINI